MEYKDYLKVSVILFFLLCLVPFGVKAETGSYEVGLKYYSIGENFDPTYTEDWLDQFREGSISELTDNVLKPGDTFVVATTLKTIDTSNANSMAFALYYRYNSNLIQIADVDTPALFDKRISTRGGIFPTSSWNYDVLNTDNIGEVAITFRDTKISAPTSFTNTEEGPVAFVFFTVKDDAVAGESINFNWITELNNTDGLYTMGSTSDSQAVIVESVDSSLLTVFEESQSDVSLSSLSVSNGSTNYLLNPEFVSGSIISSYSTVVPAHIDTVTINATATNGNITPVGPSEKSLTVGDNHFEFIVMAKDGTSQIYSVDVKRLSNVATLDSLSLSNITLNESFDSNIFTYTTNIDYQINSTTVTATATTPATIKEGTGQISFQSVGLNTINILVEAENCQVKYASVVGNSCTSNTYQVNVARESASSDATLTNIMVDGVEVSSFAPDTLEYSVKLSNGDASSTNIVATVNDPNAIYIVNGSNNLTSGDNVVTIVVTAEDNITTKTYTLNIRVPVKDVTLKSLTVTSNPQGVLSPSFNYNQNDYIYTYDESEDPIEIVALANSEYANVSIDHSDTRAVIIVTAEAGNIAEYIINFERRQSTVSTLKILEVKYGDNSYPLSPEFNKGVLEYDVVVPNEISEVTIEASATSQYTQNITGLGEVTLQVGENKKEIEVTAEDGTTKTKYIINITREPSNNAYLTDIQVDGVTVDGFNSTIESYEMEVANDISSIMLLATTSDTEATIDSDSLGVKLLQVGDNLFSIIVTAHDQVTTKIYNINIIRKASSNNNINSLTVFGKNAAWNNQLNKFQVEINYEVDTLVADDIEAVLPQGASINKGTGMSLLPGINDYTITVFAEDGTEKSYTIEITRNLSDDNELTNLMVYGKTPVFNDVYKQYELEVENSISNLTPDDIEATVPSGASLDKGLGMSLVVGNNTYSIIVTASNGAVKIYNIIITRKEALLSNDNDLIDLEVTGYTLTPSFDKDILSYSIGNISYDVDELTIIATTSDHNASIKYYINDNIQISNTVSLPLVEGSATIKIEIIAEDTSKKEYLINYEKERQISYTITSSVHTIIDENIMTVKLSTTGIEIKNQLDNPNEHLEIWLSDDSRKIEDGEKLETGMIVKLMIDGIEKDRKFIVIKGDTTGDGEIDLLDAVKILNHYLSRTLLTGAYHQAAFVNADSEIDLLDSVMILNHYLGRTSLH